MNARVIDRRLMSNRMVGRSACLTIRFPLACVPSSPRFDRPVGDEVMPGSWEEPLLPDGAQWVTTIRMMSSDVDPRGSVRAAHAVPRLVEQDDGIWRWWQGDRSLWRPDGAVSVPMERHPVPLEVVVGYRDFVEWEARYLCFYYGEPGVPFLDALWPAVREARATGHLVTESYVYLTFSVRWFYRDMRQRFVASLRRAFDAAKVHGVAMKLMRVGDLPASSRLPLASRPPPW